MESFISKLRQAGIYISIFTNVCFWAKIEFSNVVKCKLGSWGAVSSAMVSWWSPAGVQGVKSLKDFGVFTYGGHMNSLK